MRSIKPSIVVALVVFISQVSLGQSVSSVKEHAAFDAQELERINEVMERGVETGRIIGCSALIFKDGQEAYFKTWGYQDKARDVPMKRDSIFRIYSMSKPITSVAVMTLVEQNKIKLDEPAATYLPEFKDLKVLVPGTGDEPSTQVPPKRPLTVRDLLRHTSGMPYGFFGNSEVDQMYRKNGILMTDRDVAEMTQKLGKLPLKNHPATRFEYSVSTDVLGRLVEVASGVTFDEYLRQTLFTPLGMNDTSFFVPESKRERVAEMYRDTDDGLKPSPKLASYRMFSKDNRFFSGGGGLCSTIDDYLNFCKMLINGGKFKERQILSQKSLDQMFTNQLGAIEEPPRGFQFGLGFRIDKRREGGADYSWGGLAGTRFWVNPELKLATLYMIQINPYRGRSFGNQVRRIAYESLK